MASTETITKTTAGTHTVTIPSYARNIVFSLRGACGGTAGASAYVDPRRPLTCGSGTDGGQGQWVTGTFLDSVKGETLTITLGSPGINNATAYGYDAGSNGGGGYYSGGRGGVAPGAETWCTAGGGCGGGGASAIVSEGNSLMVGAGGGGGAGGNAFGFSGFETYSIPGYSTTLRTNNPSGSNGGDGGNGTDSANAGSGGGGGGWNGGGGGGDNISGNHIPGFGGQGGSGYYNTSFCSGVSVKSKADAEASKVSSGYFSVTYDAIQPPVVTLSIAGNLTSIIRGECITLTWSATGDQLTSASLTDYTLSDTNRYGGSAEFCPENTTIYTYSATNEGGTTNVSKSITVYIPPVITVLSDKSSIVIGESANISWNTTGDADTIYWTSGDPAITNLNLNSNSNVSPTDTTTYCAYVDGLGGTSPTSCVEIVVYQIPTIDDFDVPISLNYGEQGVIVANYTYANVSVTIDVEYTYVDVNGNEITVSKPSINLSPSGSAEISGSNTSVINDNVDTSIEYDDFGPRSIRWTLKISGSGGLASRQRTTSIIIDELPTNLDLLDTTGLVKDEQPAYTPQIIPEDVILTDLYEITDIDIPVEIKSNYPLEVDINQSGVWGKVREL